MDKGLLVTRLMTDQNHLVNIPNGNVLSSNVTNYRIEDKQSNGMLPPPIVKLLVDFSYDVPVKQAHEIILDATKDVGFILKEPAPYVLHHALGHNNAVYELSVFTNDYGDVDAIRSQLRQGIQERCFQEGISLVIPQAIGIGEKGAIEPTQVTIN